MKNLFIVYPGGCGGNHLANIISTNSKFTPLFDSENYHNDLLVKYKEVFQTVPTKGYQHTGTPHVHHFKSHFSKHTNLEQLHDELMFNQLCENKTVNILMGHEHCFEQAEVKLRLISKVPDPFWLVLNFPKIDSIPYNRIKLYGLTPRPERYTFPFNCTMYKGNVYASSNLENSILIETEELFTDYGVDYVREKLYKLDIEIPSIADELHKLWFNKLQEILVLYNSFPK